MHVASIEADQRAAAPAAWRSSTGDLFAELLRQHARAKEPALQPKDEPAPPAPGQREHSAAAADPRREADCREQADAAAGAEPQPATRPAEAEKISAGDPAPGSSNDPVPAEAAPVPTDRPGAAPTVIPSAAPLTMAAPSGAAAAAGETTAPAQPAAAPIPADSGMPAADPADAATAETSSRPQAATAAPPVPTATGSPSLALPADESPAAAAPPQPAPPTKGAQAGAADPAVMKDLPQAASAADTTSDPGAADVAVEAKRAPAAAALAQGLGKLGSGAETALAAQAIGDTMRAMTAGNARPQPTAAVQPTTADPDPSTPAAATAGSTPQAATATAAAAAPGSGQPSVPTPQQNGGDGRSFDAALAAATQTDQSSSAPPGAVADGVVRAAGAPGKPLAPSSSAPIPAAPAEQVAVQIHRAVRDGNGRITVQLNPAELGHVEIKLDFAQDGRVSAAILADRPETLDMLQRDARLLERSLQDAGLKADGGSLSFDLRDGGRGGADSQQTAGGFRDARGAQARGEDPTGTEGGTTQPTMASTADGGVDIRV